MPQEQEATIAGLKTALQMEKDGKKFYLKASKASRNELGSRLLKKLAAEEDIHQEVFKNIYKAIKNKKQWPDTPFTPDHGTGLRTVFSAAMKSIGKDYKSMPEEADAAKIGMDMENKTLAFYKERSTKTLLAAEKQFYEALAGQEYEHFRVLQDYYEFLVDPAGYFVKTEHTSVDGG
jgi:rubrerythrin